MTSLAFSVYSNKGIYALLLGSGVSRASGIPTGWEIVLDLIQRIAQVEGDNCGNQPEEWFKGKYGEEPDYSKILDRLAKTQTERQQLLRGHFEPNEDINEKAPKRPSLAHKAIAKLVAAGYIRVIVTTNFDRLIETALEEIGITPSVISTTDQLDGALPLAHSNITIVKLHGDYLDTRIKNTPSELEKYDKKLNALLDQIFDEYGLIISGWSADWDVALRAALERVKTRRFSTYLTTITEPSSKAKELVQHRQATIVQTDSADSFFQSLCEKVQALSDLSAPHPLSAKMATATVKRHLVDPSARIRLRDLVHNETEKLFAAIHTTEFNGQAQQQLELEMVKRISRYEALCETLLAMLITSGYWGDLNQSKLWGDALQRIANQDNHIQGSVYLLELRNYPTLLLLYGAGIASIATGNMENLAAILTKPQIKVSSSNNIAIGAKINAIEINQHKTWQSLPELNGRHTPVSDHLFEVLREPLREFLPNDEDYQEVFDRFEYMLGLFYADTTRHGRNSDQWWGPFGCFAWRSQISERQISHKVSAEITAEGKDWPPLKAGLFGGSLEQAQTACIKFNNFLKQLNLF